MSPAVEQLPVVAAFDVDGTITTRDCVVPFLRRVAGTTRLAARLTASLHRLAPAALRRDRNEFKAIAARAALAGRSIVDVNGIGREFAGTIDGGWLRSDTLSRLRWHVASGHTVVLVSASFAAYLRPLGERLGVTDVIACELETSPEGTCTGELIGGNCRGPAKVQRLHDWLDGNHGGRGAVEVWAYGDSTGDRELLADADQAVWVKGQHIPTPVTTA